MHGTRCIKANGASAVSFVGMSRWYLPAQGFCADEMKGQRRHLVVGWLVVVARLGSIAAHSGLHGLRRELRCRLRHKLRRWLWRRLV